MYLFFTVKFFIRQRMLLIFFATIDKVYLTNNEGQGSWHLIGGGIELASMPMNKNDTKVAAIL